MRFLSRLALFAFLSTAALAPAVPITVTYTDGASEGFNDPTLGASRRASFEYAMAIWANRLAGNITVRVNAAMDPDGGTANSAGLGFAGPGTAWSNFSGTPQNDTWYVNAIANQLAGTDIDNGSEFEVYAVFNSDVDNQVVLGSSDWYYGLDESTANGDISFVRVVLHEFGHALGFIGLVDTDNSGDNPTGNYESNIPSSYDRLVRRGNASNTAMTSLTQSQRQAALTSDNLYWFGPVTFTSSGQRIRLYAPTTWEPGSSYSHFREGTPVQGVEELMEPFYDTELLGLTNTDDVFDDIGWNLLGPSLIPDMTISTAPTSATEGTPFNVTFSLSSAQTQTVTANLLFSSTATFNTDYTVSATSLTFNPGVLSQSITITPINDGINDSGEAIFIRLSRIVGAEFGSTISSTTVLSNGPAPTFATGWMLY